MGIDRIGITANYVHIGFICVAYGVLLLYSAAVGYVNCALVTHVIPEVLFLAMTASVIECTIICCTTVLEVYI